MLSFVLQDGSVPEMFRSLSRGRRQGVLEVRAETITYEFEFYSGKIVTARRRDEDAAVGISRILVSAGIIDEGAPEKIADMGLHAQQVQQFLVNSYGVTEDQFIRAKHAYELNVLHSLRAARSVSHEFKPLVLQVDQSLALDVFPGQALLDIAALDLDAERFATIFGSDDWRSTIVFPENDPEVRMTPNEQHVWGLLAEESCLQTIADRAMLSGFELQEVLLALYDNELISVELLSGAAGSTEEEEEEDTPLFPQGMVPPADIANKLYREAKTVTEEIEDELDNDLQVMEKAGKDDIVDDSLDTVEVLAAQPKRAADIPGVDISISDSDILELDMDPMAAVEEYERQLMEEADTLRITEESEPVQSTVKQVTQVSSVAVSSKSVTKTQVNKSSEVEKVAPQSVGELFAALGRALLSDDMLPITAAVVTLPFLVCVAIYAPELIETWLDSLAKFSSALRSPVIP